MTFKSKLKIASAMAALALVGAGGAAQAANLVSNGNFTSSTGGTTVADGLTNNAGLSFLQTLNEETLSSWTAHGFSFVFTNTTGSGASPDGLTLKSLTAPTGGEDFVGIDPAYQNPSCLGFSCTPVASGISQNVSGLIQGDVYALTFEWAGAQQASFNGATTEWWTVDFGGTSQQSTSHTAVGNDSGHANPDFSGWFDTTLTFVATGTSEVITFLAEGTGTAAQPPFDLLANVGLTQTTTVPEPASIALFGAGMVGLGGFAASRRRKKK